MVRFLVLNLTLDWATARHLHVMGAGILDEAPRLTDVAEGHLTDQMHEVNADTADRKHVVIETVGVDAADPTKRDMDAQIDVADHRRKVEVREWDAPMVEMVTRNVAVRGEVEAASVVTMAQAKRLAPKPQTNL